MTELSIAEAAQQDASGSGDNGAERCNDTVINNNAAAAASAAAAVTNYPYLKILERLQNESTTTTAATTTTTTNDQWDLSSDAQLATLLHEFTNHIVARTHHVSCDIRAVQNSVNNVGVNVALVQTEFMKRSSDIFMEQVVGDDDDEEESSSSSSSSSDDIISDEKGKDNAEETKSKVQKQEEEEDDGDSDNSSADIARLELEEQSAISDGMKALNLFFDVNKRKSPPPPNGSDSESGNNGGGGGEQATMLSMNVEEDMIGDNCYFYQAAEDDGFNQRPLPFIIGSREFMEASRSPAG